MILCGFHLKPSKGYHFLDSPYVEYYYNAIPTINEKQDLTKLQLAFQQLLHQNVPTKIELLSKEEAHIRCNSNSLDEPFFDMDMYCTAPHDSTVRIVTVAGYPCPCGGTHVRSTGDLLKSSSSSSTLNQTWTITGIKCKPKGFVRIKYGRISNNLS
jgi:Ser-tRNA(Ala) deacylase AlaX